MSIPTPNDLKAMMKDLEQRKKVLTKHFDQFEQLQTEIQTLNQRANKGDATSIRKLTNLNNAFPNGFEQQQQQIMTKAKELEQNFQTLKHQFQGVRVKSNIASIEHKENNIKVSNSKRPKMKSFC